VLGILSRTHGGDDKLKKVKLQVLYFVIAIEDAKDLSHMKIEELQGSLETHEMKIKQRSSNSNVEESES